MRIGALHKETPKRAPGPKAVPRTQPAFRKPTSIPTPPLGAHEPPPLRLAAAHLPQTEAIAYLDRAPDSWQSLSASSLAISSPHDAAEKEARSTASKIVRMPARSESTSYVSTAANTVFRLVKPARDRETLRIKECGPGPSRSALTIPLIARSSVQVTIHRQIARETGAVAHTAANIAASMTGGEALPIGVRQF